MTTEPGHSRQSEFQQFGGQPQTGEPDRSQPATERERGQSAQQRQSPMQTGQSRLREQYSQRIDPDRRGQGEQPPPTDRGQQGKHAQRGRPSPQFRSGRGPERDRGETNVTDETEDKEMDRPSDERSARSAITEGDADEEHGIDEE